MKKITTIILIIVILTVVTATFMGCGDKDISDLRNDMNVLNNKFNDLSNQYKELEGRVKKLETTISLLDTVGDSTQFIELKNKVIELQKDLLNNVANDAQIKTQVTQMQLVLDKISGGGNVDPAILGEIQYKLNTLYGEVNRVLPFENGKEYEVKLNGVVYYTVSVLIEYHDGVVQSNQDIQNCPTKDRKHFCGSIYIKNRYCPSIECTNSRLNITINYFDNNKFYSSLINNKEASGPSAINAIKVGEEGRLYFDIDPLQGGDSLPETDFKMIFRLPNNLDFNLLILDDVWGDENGVKPPIIGTKN
ncbi:MAG: hypothetical protein K2K85_01210 [Clostridia bacterium]|nr:hypothetical protein [Clostridia bacterium]